MALWYISPRETRPTHACPVASSLDTLRATIAEGQAAHASDHVAEQFAALPEASECLKVNLEVRTKNLMVFSAVVSQKTTRFELRIEVLRKTGRIASTFRHRGRTLDPNCEFFLGSIANFQVANATLFTWLREMLRAGLIDYRAQSPKIRLDEEKRWGHPFPFEQEDLHRLEEELAKVLQSIPDYMGRKWAATQTAMKLNRDRDRKRQAIMNALPDGALIAVASEDRMYGEVGIKIGRKQGPFGPKAARFTRLLNERDLSLMKQSKAFSVSKHDELRIIQEIRANRINFPEACSFQLQYASLRAPEEQRPYLHGVPCLASYKGDALPSPGTKTGTLSFDWAQGHPNIQHLKRFSPCQDMAWPDRLSDHVERNFQGGGLAGAGLPCALKHSPALDEPPLRLHRALNVNGLWIISPDLRAVLDRHDIGETSFLPVTLLDADENPCQDSPWFYVSFQERQARFDATLQPKSLGLSRYTKAPHRLFGFDHDMIHLTQPERPELDLWVDPGLAACFFMSGRLAQAIRAARLGTRFGLKRCLTAL